MLKRWMWVDVETACQLWLHLNGTLEARYQSSGTNPPTPENTHTGKK